MKLDLAGDRQNDGDRLSVAVAGDNDGDTVGDDVGDASGGDPEPFAGHLNGFGMVVGGGDQETYGGASTGHQEALVVELDVVQYGRGVVAEVVDADGLAITCDGVGHGFGPFTEKDFIMARFPRGCQYPYGTFRLRTLGHW